MTFLFKERMSFYLNSAREIFILEGRVDLAEVLQLGIVEVELKTGYDNWDGGQYFHTLIFKVPLETFHKVVTKLDSNAQDIKDMINKVSSDLKNESLEAVNILLDDNVNKASFNLLRLSKGEKVNSAFDEYTLMEKIGQGGNGVVFSARGKDGDNFAIKFLNTESSDKKFKRFKNEIGFCEKCCHPNIVQILDHGCVNVNNIKYSFYVMPQYEKSLRDKIKEGILPADAVSIFIEILKGLEVAHKQNVIHRDVKPENIMFMKGSNKPIICDFGIAHIPLELEATTVVTQPTDRMANWNYASPEQRIKGGRALFQSDIYSAALILNEMFTGEVPNAAGYKTIGQCVPEYSYLDEVFKLIFRQNPEERLYPEDKIFTEMAARAAIHRNNIELKRLHNIITASPKSSVVSLHVSRKEYENGYLYFVFDENVPVEWLNILKQGAFNHSSVMGYDTDCVERESDNMLKMNIENIHNAESVKNIIGWFYEWVDVVNAKYLDLMRHRDCVEQRAREEVRMQKIARLQRENEMKQLIARL